MAAGNASAAPPAPGDVQTSLSDVASSSDLERLSPALQEQLEVLGNQAPPLEAAQAEGPLLQDAFPLRIDEGPPSPLDPVWDQTEEVKKILPPGGPERDWLIIVDEERVIFDTEIIRAPEILPTDGVVLTDAVVVSDLDALAEVDEAETSMGPKVVVPPGTKPVSAAVVPTASASQGQESFVEVVAVGSPRSWNCSGVRVGPRTVVTAAHCLPATQVQTEATVRSNTQGAIAVVATAVAPGGVDAALLRLERPVDGPTAAWRGQGDVDEPRGTGQVAGYGSTRVDGGGQAGVRNDAEVELSGWGCDATRSVTLGCHPGLEFIVVSSNGVDTCEGDSGGPIFETTPNGRRLLGITSRALPGSESRCGGGGIYVRIDVNLANEAVHIPKR